MAAYNEIGGMNWEQKRDLGIEKNQRIRQIKRGVYRYLAYSDYLVHGLRMAGLDKPAMREVMRRYSNFLYQNKICRKYDEEHLHTLPGYIFHTRPTTAIHGQDIKL